MTFYILLILALSTIVPCSWAYCYDCHKNPTIEEITCQLNLGDIPLCPAKSCKEIADTKLCNVRSGLHWLSTTCGTNFQGFCNVTIPPSPRKGWTRIGYINSSESCPKDLKEITAGGKQLCAKNVNIGCSSVVFQTHGISYSKVCGRVYGYQQDSPDGTNRHYHCPNCNIDQPYVDGVSITHGSPRQHIWTLAAAAYHPLVPFCSCGNNTNIPSFVEQDFFCDLEGTNTYNVTDRLWDGQHCLTQCCSVNGNWFCKDRQPTTENIEFRVCADEARSNEDVYIEYAELYIH